MHANIGKKNLSEVSRIPQVQIKLCIYDCECCLLFQVLDGTTELLNGIATITSTIYDNSNAQSSIDVHIKRGDLFVSRI